MITTTEELPYTIIHRGEGVLIVRAHSKNRRGRPLPDTSFTFRPGEPQYDSWLAIYNEMHPDNIIEPVRREK